jgi:hypothetical protein
MAERFKYNGTFKHNTSKGESGLPSIRPAISGLMFPTSLNAMNSKEWIESRKSNSVTK